MGGVEELKKESGFACPIVKHTLGGRFRGALTLPMGVRNRHIGVRKRT